MLEGICMFFYKAIVQSMFKDVALACEQGKGRGEKGGKES